MRNYQIPLVWVHLGNDKIPKHLLGSLQSARKVFPEVDFVLISDYRLEHKQLEQLNVSLFELESVNDLWDDLKTNLNHDLSFRSGFWFNSLARLLCFEKFLERTSHDKLVHIESDVLLLDAFPLSAFHTLGEKVAFPIQSRGQGIASVLYLGSQRMATLLTNFTMQNVLKNASATDMTTLWDFSQEYPQYVQKLPSKPCHLLEGTEMNTWMSPRGYPGVFDSISIGQYLFGIDPRNFRGKLKLFTEDITHYVKPSRWRLEWTSPELLFRENNQLYSIFNLHIHSKDLRCFKAESFEKLIAKRIDQCGRIKTEWVWSVLFRSCWFWFKKSLFTNKKYTQFLR